MNTSDTAPEDERLPAIAHVTLSPEIYLKSATVGRKFAKKLRKNMRAALGTLDVEMRPLGSARLELKTSDYKTAADRLARVFGIHSIARVETFRFETLDDLVETLTPHTQPLVAGKRFAVRVKRRGVHEWRRADLERALGAALLPVSGGVDLTNPEETVQVRIEGQRAHVLLDRIEGAGGMPLASQGRVLVLLSGGFDSPVAAWSLMSRGVSVEFVHFKLECSQSDHALAVAQQLWSEWGMGTRGRVHVLEFQPVKDALRAQLDPRLRQIVLKRIMMMAGDGVAARLGIPVLATGEAIGQVSSQTFPHLVELDQAIERPIFRPLLTVDKNTIVQTARRIGTFDLSSRAIEVCDLSDGEPVATRAKHRDIVDAEGKLGSGIITDALSQWEVADLATWLPGEPLREIDPTIDVPAWLRESATPA
jgi:tRNA uracil 4-sulfurtransferase